MKAEKSKMKVLTEADLRASGVVRSSKEYHVPEGTFVTPTAKEYLRDNNISLIFDTPHASMSRTPIKKQGNHTYVDALTGEGYSKKPEDMTHLRGNILVPKTHPRIALRGMLDSLQAQVLLMEAKNVKNTELRCDLENIRKYLAAVLAAEVKEEALGEIKLFGLGDERLREMSHNVRQEFGIDHPIPDYTMGETALEVNLLRTRVREAELCAANAFPEGDKLNIIRHLNRLSSGVYIMFCRLIAGRYGGRKEDIHG